MTQRLDQQLIEAARAGDKAALEILLERYQPKVYRFGMKMCRDPDDAEDVLQDTLLSMARSIHDFRGASTISTWLYSIARSHCLKKRRRSKYAPEEEISLEGSSGEVVNLVHEGRRPDEAVADREVRRALEDAIAALEPIYREVLILRDVEGLTAPEVAEILGIKVQAVKSRLHRARLAVREEVAHLLMPPEPREHEATETCPDVLMLFSKYLEGEISAELCTTMEAHLERCPSCSDSCESLKRTLALCRSSAVALEVPEKVQASVHEELRRFLQENG